MKSNALTVSQPQIGVRETNSDYEITVTRKTVMIRKYGVHISWPVLAIAALFVSIIILFAVTKSARSTPISSDGEAQIIMAPAMNSPAPSFYSNLKASFLSSGFVFPNSDTVYLTVVDLEQLYGYDDLSYNEMLRFAVNEIYARHGYLFQLDQFFSFYSKYNWYHGYLSAEETVTYFNDVEKYNIGLLLAAEKELG